MGIHRRSGKALLALPLLIGFALGVFFSPVLSHSEVREPAITTMASPTSISCLRVPAMSVNSMQGVLRKNGVAPSPMEKFALTSFAATRNPSMKAQAKDEYEKLDHATQTKLKQLSKDLVVRAASFSPEDMAGVSAPLGFWDPAGFAKDEESVAQYRRAEIKHGRVCMQASLGMLVADKFHPIFDKWNEGPFVSSMASHFTETATKNFWPAFWIMTAGHELATSLVDYEGKELADYGFDPLNLKPQDPEELKVLENKELNNGRLAMLGASDMIAQELVTGKSIF